MLCIPKNIDFHKISSSIISRKKKIPFYLGEEERRIYMAAEKYQHGYPLAPASVMPRSDEESAAFRSIDEHELKKKKRLRCFAYIAIFAVFQTIIILVFALTVMRFKTPKVELTYLKLKHWTASDKIIYSSKFCQQYTTCKHIKFIFHQKQWRIYSGGSKVTLESKILHKIVKNSS